MLSEYAGEFSDASVRVAFYGAVCACLLLPMLVSRGRNSAVAIQVVVVALAVVLGFARHQSATALPANNVGALVGDERVLTRIAGRVATQPMTSPVERRNPYLPYEPEPRTRFVLAARELRVENSAEPVCGNIRVIAKTPDIEADLGDEVVVTGWLFRMRGPQNPGETDWARLYRLQNIHAGISVESAEHVRRESSSAGAASRVTAWLRGRARSLLFEPLDGGESDEPQRLLDAMVLGHRSAAGRALNEAFLRTGAVHFLTVSGFHVGVLGGAVWVLVRRILRRGSRSAAISSMMVMLVYAVIVEPNAPVMRATTMGVLLCLAQLARRPLCGLNWLALAALCVLSVNPLELFRAGFQLSFVQVIAIFTIVPQIYRLLIRRHAEGDVPADAESWPALALRTFWRWFAGLTVVCVTAWIVALPLVLHHFGRFAPWGALQSIIVSPLVMLVIVLGFATLAVSWVIPAAGVWLGVLLRGSTDALLWAVERLGNWPGALVETTRPAAWIVIVTYALVLTLLWILRRSNPANSAAVSGQMPVESSRRGRRTALMVAGSVTGLACLWIGWLLSPMWSATRGCEIYLLSVGSGSAVLITAGDGGAMLVDAGTIYNFDAGETVTTAARALGVRRLDRIAISHANSDHYSGVPTAARELRCGDLLLSPYFEPSAEEDASVRRFLESLPAGTRRRTMVADDEFSSGSATVEVLWPPEGLETWAANDRSLVLRVNYGGRSVLIPGDIEREALRELVEQHELGEIDLHSDVLIAPHHGSVLPRDTAAFYEAVAPQTVINSTGYERPKLTAMLKEFAGGEAIQLLSTDEVGAVTIRITAKGELKIEAPFADHR